jgi:hypothetical protein
VAPGWRRRPRPGRSRSRPGVAAAVETGSAGRRSSRPNPSSVRLSVTLVRLSGVPSGVSRVEISAPVTLLRRERSDLRGNDPEAPSPTTVDRLRTASSTPRIITRRRPAGAARSTTASRHEVASLVWPRPFSVRSITQAGRHEVASLAWHHLSLHARVQQTPERPNQPTRVSGLPGSSCG